MQEKLKQWAPQEIQLLKEMNNLEKHRKWKKVSLYFQQRGLNRSHVECRNKWVNSLAPDINHRPWTEEELRLLFSLYETHESSWSSIQRQMPGRTQIKIKNHFYGVLRGIIRFVLKYFKEAVRKQTKISNRITPISLQHLYKGAGQFSFLGSIIPQTVAIMEYRFNKRKLVLILENNLSKFQRLNKQILDQVNKSSLPQRFESQPDVPSQDCGSNCVQPEENENVRQEDKLQGQPTPDTELRTDFYQPVGPTFFQFSNLYQFESMCWHSYPTQIGYLPCLPSQGQTNCLPSIMEYYVGLPLS